MPTSSYDAFERWLDSVLYDTNITCNIKTNTMTVKKPVSPFEVQSVLSNRKKNAFTVVWADGTHTTIHCQPGDEWDDEKALAMCFAKKALGNKGNFNDKFNDALDSKMKVIPAESVSEKKCACDGTCTECKCKEESFADAVEKLQSTCAKTKDLKNAFGLNKQTADELSKAATETSNPLKEMIDALTGETTPKDNETKKDAEKTYYIYLWPIYSGTPTKIYTAKSIDEVREFIKQDAIKKRLGYYFRTWNTNNNDGMFIDFGSHTYYYHIPGLTNSEYIGN